MLVHFGFCHIFLMAAWLCQQFKIWINFCLAACCWLKCSLQGFNFQFVIIHFRGWAPPLYIQPSINLTLLCLITYNYLQGCLNLSLWIAAPMEICTCHICATLWKMEVNAAVCSRSFARSFIDNVVGNVKNVLTKSHCGDSQKACPYKVNH